jgi:hypothetical protein
VDAAGAGEAASTTFSTTFWAGSIDVEVSYGTISTTSLTPDGGGGVTIEPIDAPSILFNNESAPSKLANKGRTLDYDKRVMRGHEREYITNK